MTVDRETRQRLAERAEAHLYAKGSPPPLELHPQTVLAVLADLDTAAGLLRAQGHEQARMWDDDERPRCALDECDADWPCPAAVFVAEHDGVLVEQALAEHGDVS